MSFSSEIMARLGLDTAGFTNGLKKAKAGVENFAEDAGKAIKNKLGGADIARGIMQGLGIGSVQQIAERIVKPFREAAEYAQRIATLTDQAANANIARMRSSASLENQAALAEQDRARLAREVAELSSRSVLSDEDRVRLLEKANALREAESSSLELSAKLAAQQAAATEQQRQESAKWFAERDAAAMRDREAAAKKEEAERKVTEELARQRTVREELIRQARIEAAESERRLDLETDIAASRADTAAAGMGLEAVTPEERQALRDWIKGGRRGPAPLTRSGSLRDSLSSGALGATEFLVDGRRIAGQARSRAEFDQASPEALREFIRRQSLTVGQIQGNFGRGEQALTDVVTGGLVRNLAASVLQTEIGFARDRLRDFNRFAGADRRTALRDFEGDPLAFDRLFESSQRNFEAADRAAAGIERLTRLFETGAARSSSVITGASPGVFPPRD